MVESIGMTGDKSASDPEISVRGLDESAEIIVDRWGIPHLYAKTRRDVFFVQGFNAARDRLWQLDIWRKRGLGQLAADFGPGFLAQDRAARLFLYRGDMEAEWRAYGATGARAIAEAFAEGVNAFIKVADEAPHLLPPEFEAMGTRPCLWEASDIVRIRSHAVVRNVASEVLRAKVAAAAGIEADAVRQPIRPPWTPMRPDPLALEDYPADLLDVYNLATCAVTFPPDRLAAVLDDAWLWAKVNDLGQVDAMPRQDGSNNWAIGPDRTASGRPILANDPHRLFSLPSLRYVAHLNGPGIDIVGAGEPALPGVSIGHNGKAAFGLTIFPIDQEDLYIYVTDPDDPCRYRYDGGWEAMRIIRERIVVKGAPDQEVTLKFSRHGPIICEDRDRRRAYAIRSVWLEPGGSAYFGSLAYLDASTPDEFAAALRHWSVPAVNHVYADRAGNIARFAAAKAPRRRGWDGLFPVPGDGRFEWDGFHSASDLPRIVNPPSGLVASANEMSLPADYPYGDRKLGFEWDDGFRAARVQAVLESQSRHTIADSRALQNDEFSIIAERVCACLSCFPSDGADFAIGTEMLRKWDFRMTRDSAPAALFEVWWSRRLKPALLAQVSPEGSVQRLLAPGSDDALVRMLEQAGRQAANSPGDLLEQTLRAALADCRVLLGAEPKTWKWGTLHRIHFVHPLAAVAGSPERPLRNVGPLPMGGGASTVMAARHRASDFSVDLGASFKMIVDVGNWDESLVINAPGQSGDPGSPHYDDIAPTWNNHGYVPLLYSRAAVESAAKLRIRLTPKAQERSGSPPSESTV